MEWRMTGRQVRSQERTDMVAFDVLKVRLSVTRESDLMVTP